jgi:shikimate kinase
MNIVLIGIMGCGKSTIGKLLAKKLHYDFIDADDYLVNKYQMSIPDMFAISEDYFRQK